MTNGRIAGLVWCAAVCALSAACSAPGAEELGASREAATTPFANDKPAYDYFRGKGFTNLQAAAIVGNLDQESGVNPTISQNGGGVGRGIAQWSAGARWDTTKGDNVKDFAAQQGKSMTALDLQLDFIMFELTTFPDDYGYTQLKATTTLNDATQVFEDEYEGCVYANYPECALPSRQKFAANVLAAYGDDPVPGGADASGASGSGGAGAGGAGGGSAGATSAGDSGASAGGAPGSAGAANAAGAPSSAGASGASVAGAPSSAGAASATGGANAAGSVSFSAPDTSSGCAVAWVAPGQLGGTRWLSVAGVVAGLGLARARRRRAVR